MSLAKWLDERLDGMVAWRTGSPRDIALHGKKWSTAKDPRWKNYFAYFCESPAETRFLEAMLSEFELQPREGKLVGRGLSLDLQVEIFRYRADFVANDKLVIEIDGATYHSYPQAVERDKKRDKDLTSLGFEILRIPAQTIFDDPSDAISRVRRAIAATNSTFAVQHPQESPTGKVGSRRPFVKIATVLETIDKSITCSIESQKALAPARAIFHAQKLLFETGLERAQGDIKTEEFRSRSTQHAELFDQPYARFAALLAKELDGAREESGDVFADAKQAIVAPTATGDQAIDDRIRRDFSELLLERSSLMQSIRSALEADARTERHFRNFLEDHGCATFWPEIERAA